MNTVADSRRRLMYFLLGFGYLPALVALAALVDAYLLDRMNITWFVLTLPLSLVGANVANPGFRRGMNWSVPLLLPVLVVASLTLYPPPVAVALWLGFSCLANLALRTGDLLALIRRALRKDEYLKMADAYLVLRYYGLSILFFTLMQFGIQATGTPFLKVQNETVPLVDLFYFNVVTFTTLGYGDIVPVTATAKVVVAVENLLSFFLVALGIGLIVKGVRDAPASPGRES
ncbi:MAG TPA: potassium channel family protein [Longimicrobium sp.]|nr:potassium channel family protein [Longimicrobium sp.]